MTIDTASLSEAFAEMRAKQAELHGRATSGFDLSTAQSVFRAAEDALRSVEEDDHNIAFRVVSPGNGAGKSMSAVALIAAGFVTSPDFTAAYVVPEVPHVESFRRDLAALIGDDNVTCWSRAHDLKRNDKAIFADYGFVPDRTWDRGDLLTARIVIVTQAKWLEEIATAKDLGIRHFNGRSRNVIFVDELPEIVSTPERIPAHAVALHNRVSEATDDDHPWLPAIRLAMGRMQRLYTEQGVRFTAPLILEPEHWRLFADIILPTDMLPFVDKRLPTKARNVEAADLFETVNFLKAAAQGMAFMCRAPRRFIGYKLANLPGPGHVLLDATADLSGFTALAEWADAVETREVDYSDLATFHLDMPKDFLRPSTVLSKITTARPYAAWIKRTLLENTAPGDDVFLVAHKALFEEFDLLPLKENPDDPWIFQGRRINTTNWGSGVGTNAYRSKSKVFLIGEFHRPSRANVAWASALTGVIPTDERLREANGTELQGDFLTAKDGHLLRHQKQMATRGTCRVIDGHGKAAPMTLFTTAKLSWLLKHWQRMFPKAPAPVPLRATEVVTEGRTQTANKKGVPALIDLIAGPEPILTTDVIEKLTGIPSTDLSKRLKLTKVADAMVTCGRVYEPGKSSGQRSRIVRIETPAV
jgi:hypothetical protein